MLSLEEQYLSSLLIILEHYSCVSANQLICDYGKFTEVQKFEEVYQQQLYTLLNENERAIERYIRKYHDNNKDDLKQEAMLGLIAGFKRFDPRKGPFYPYAKYWMDKYILVELNKQKYVALTSQSYDYELLMHDDVSGDPLDILLSLEEDKLVEQCIVKLPKQQKKFVVSLLDHKNKATTLSELAKSSCISRSRASQIIKSAGEKIRCSILKE